MIVTGRRPRLSASRPAKRMPTSPGKPSVIVRKSATSEFEKSCALVR